MKKQLKKYRNVSGKDLFVRGSGLVKKDAIVESVHLSNKKFEEVKGETEQKKSGEKLNNLTKK